MSDRHSLAAQARMKAIAALAADDNASTTMAGNKRRRKKDEEDTFGANDDDWMIYREISKEDDSDEEEDDQEQLEHVETLLVQHDPDFNAEENLEWAERKNEVYYRMHYGPNGYHDPHDPAQHYLNVERVRVPEILFQPLMVGMEEAGLAEMIHSLLRQLDANQQKKLVKVNGMNFIEFSGVHEL